MKKRILSIALCAALLLTMVPAAFAEEIHIVDSFEESSLSDPLQEAQEDIRIVDSDETAPVPDQTQADSSVAYRALLIGEVSFSSESAERNRGDIQLISRMLENTVGPEGNRYAITCACDLNKDGIRNAISYVYAGADSNDVSLFFMATHGIDSISSGSRAGALVTIEQPGYTEGELQLNELAEWLKAVPGKVIVVLGSCGSGAAIVENGRLVYTPDESGQAEADFSDAVIRCFEEADREFTAPDASEPQTGEFRNSKFYVLTAAAHLEESWGRESSSGMSYNYFPYYFAEGADLGMPADTNGNKLVTLNEMYQYCLEKAYGPHSDGTGSYYQHAQVYPKNSSYGLFRAVDYTASGQCGDNLTWTLNSQGTLTISGTGDMWNYGVMTAPWYEYRSFTSVVTNSRVTSIGNNAFYDCDNLRYVWLGDSLRGIGSNAFAYCDKHTEIAVSAQNPYYMAQDGVLFSKDGKILYFCPNGKSGDYSIPRGVETIYDAAFWDCPGLQHVWLPTSLKSVGTWAFAACDGLIWLVFGGSAPTFGESCFSGVTTKAYYPAANTSWTSGVTQNYGGTITWIAALDEPELTEAFNSATGVRVSWKSVNGATKYQLMRKNLTLGETAWKIVGETKSLSLIDTTAKSSNRYTYSVQAINSAGYAGFHDDTGRTCTYIAKADITNLRYGVKGVTLTWSKPAGAKNFRVMRRVDGTSTWTVLAVIEGTTYTDTTAKIGTKYWYTVRGVSMDNKTVINSYNGTGWSMRPLSTPVLTEAFNSATGVRVSWKAVNGAAKYRLLRKDVNAGTGWEIIGETTACTLIDTTAKSASRYTYTVECVDSNGRTCSTSDSTGRTCTFIALAKITSIKSVSNGVALEWSKPAGAKNFRILRKTDGGSWKVLKDIQGTSYTDTTAVKGVKYWYTVRAITLAGDMYINSYNATGWSVIRKEAC